MVQKKSRLGRGLDSLISAGVPGASAGKTAANGVKEVQAAGKAKAAPAKPAAKPVPAKAAPTPDPAPTAAAEPVATPTANGLTEIPVGKIEANPHQPRRDFEEGALKELAESIRSEGLLQPVVVRAVGDHFQLIAGERRWRACRALGMKRIPARIVQASESSSAALSLIENLQRENLNPIEEALGYASLMRDFDLTQEAVSERVGKARASIANSLRLLQLEREIQGYISKGHLSVGHAKVLLGLEDGTLRLMLARQCIERGISVRELEKLVARAKKGDTSTKPGRPAPAAETAAIQDIERHISSSLKTKVQLKHTPRKGRIIIEYYGNDDLHRIMELIGLQA